jgi:hypothetical protein
MIKNFDKFVKESVENKGKGPGNQDLIPLAPKKQTINRAIPAMDFLRVGKHILTSKIDGFIDSVQNESIFITDRITGETKKYTLKEILKELTKTKDKPTPSIVKGFEGTPAWATKQKIYEDYERQLSPEYEPDELGTEQEQEEEFGPDQEEIEIGADEEEDDVQDDDDVKNQTQNQAERNKLLYGTEDNPLGLPNKGVRRSSPNENWKKYWEKYSQQIEIVKEQLEEEIDEEDEVKIVRGTEDNPLPVKGRRKPKIENY